MQPRPSDVLAGARLLVQDAVSEPEGDRQHAGSRSQIRAQVAEPKRRRRASTRPGDEPQLGEACQGRKTPKAPKPTQPCRSVTLKSREAPPTRLVKPQKRPRLRAPRPRLQPRRSADAEVEPALRPKSPPTLKSAEAPAE